MALRPGQTICDPACGTGGFLIAAHDYVAEHHGPLDRDQWRHLNHEALHGWEIVDAAARLCVMNLYLRGIGANGDESPIHVGDSLAPDPGQRFDMVLTNPPFGKKSSVTYITEAGETRRESQTVVRDKVNLDIFWLRDESLEDMANLPDPDVLAAEIVEDLQAALEQFSEIAEDLEAGNSSQF
jgi:type I restriction-modification system DNA methylase subunit